MVKASASRALVLPALFIAGGIGGALLDQIHVRWHVLRYAHPDLAGQAWWVAPQFGVAVVLIMAVALRIARLSDRDDVPPWADGCAFVCAYLMTGIFHRYPWLALVVLLVMWAAVVRAHRQRRTVLAMSVILAVAGPIYESLLTRTGVFHYTVGQLVLRVPFWLPALYLNAGALAASTARSLLRPTSERSSSSALRPG